jgi:hypothetical protein
VSAETALAGVVEALEQVAGSDRGDYAFAVAMRRLVDWEAARQQEGEGAAAEHDRRRVGELLAQLAPQLGAYVDATFARAADSEAGLQDGALRRSAIQAILDGYGGTPAAAVIEPDDVEAIDAALRRKAAEVEPLPPDWIPAGLPADHWWWHAAASPG